MGDSNRRRTRLDWGGPLEESRIPRNCPQSFKELILNCSHIDPAKRPSAEDLVERLKLLGPELSPNFHVLIKACEQVEKLIHPKRQEGLAYIEPFVTANAVEEPIEIYWDKWESTQKPAGSNPPLNLKDIFGNFLKKPGSSTLLLLGEAGLGKTLTTYLWADELMRGWWSYIKDPTLKQPPYFPVFIRPTVGNWTHTALKGTYLKIVQQYGLKDIPLLVFVDGYDELQMDEAPSNLSEHLGLLGSKNAKLVITCRPKAVENEALPERFHFKEGLETVHFLPFSIEQLLGYLKEQLALEKEMVEAYKKTLQASKSVQEALRNPFVLYLLRQSWETLSKQPLNEINRWKIYEGFVKHVIPTQSSLLSAEVQASLAANYLSLVESFQAFASDVAFRACQKGNITFSLQEAANDLTYPWIKLQALVREDACKEFTKRKEQLNLGRKDQRRALLSESDFIGVMQKRCEQFEGDLPLAIRRDAYTFSHKSLFEYFVAKRLLEIFDSKDGFILKEDLDSLAARLIESHPEVLLFLHEGRKETEHQALTIASFLQTLGTKVTSDTVLAKISILLNAIGKVLNNQYAKYEEALEYLRQSLAIYEQLYGKDNPKVAATYNQIGLILKTQGKYEEALEYYRKDLAISEKVNGKDHPEVATSYNDIGTVLADQGKYEDALEHYKKALAIFEQVNDKDHPKVATTYNNIGLVLHNQGKHGEALEYLMKSLAIYEQVYDKDHLKVATTYHNIGGVLNAQGKYEEAIVYYKKSLATFEKTYGKDHPKVATSYTNIGFVFYKQGKYGEALEYLMKSLAICEQVNGKDHPEVATYCNMIGNLFYKQGNYTEALAYHMKSLAIKEQINGKDHPEVADYYNFIAGILKAQGKSKQAREYERQAEAIKKKLRK